MLFLRILCQLHILFSGLQKKQRQFSKFTATPQRQCTSASNLLCTVPNSVTDSSVFIIKLHCQSSLISYSNWILTYHPVSLCIISLSTAQPFNPEEEEHSEDVSVLNSLQHISLTSLFACLPHNPWSGKQAQMQPHSFKAHIKPSK